jgi:ABC-2 type transport system permease protein
VAVHKRVYRPYEGALTSEPWRFLVITRFAAAEVFESRLLAAFLVFSYIPFVIECALVYLSYSPAAQAVLGFQRPGDEFLRREFFMGALSIQGGLAFFVTAWVAPVLVSPDLVNGALPLYLSRPLSRAEYVLGKASVLGLLLSVMTWVPLALVFALLASLGPAGWAWDNVRVLLGIFAGAWVWIVVLTLIGLALSAWIRWRLVASGALFGVLFMGSAFGEMWYGMLNNPWGRLVNPLYLVGLVWRQLLGIWGQRSVAMEMFNSSGTDLPGWAAWAGLAVIAVASLAVLDRRLRAREVVS